jgi:peptidoglycan hydrolase-like protein with peptidoglycan-binding domain
MAKVGIRPPFVAGSDTDCFLWAKSWADDPNYTVLKTPRLGCVVVLTRSGGGHVSTYESTLGSNYMLRGGNQSDAINLAAFPKSSVVALVWPTAEPIPEPIEPPADRLPVLRKGDTGKDVAYLQGLLPRWIDGDFGTTTESLVKEFQRSQGLEIDGVVGEQTWAALLNEEPAPEPGPEPEPGGWIHGITATFFGGSSETEISAYPPYDRITATEISVALPDRFTGTLPTVEVMNDDGLVMTAKIRDVGPWMIDDPYWDKGARPVAEKCYASKTPLPSGPQKGRVPSNPAGIDLSAALANKMGIGGMGKVSWRLIK